MTDAQKLAQPPSATEVAEQSMRDAINELVSQCTDAQVAGLHRIHDGAPWKGLCNCPADKLPTTYELLRRTVIQNNKATRGTQMTDTVKLGGLWHLA